MSNQLAKEGSPYLRQHADNPVNWMPWHPEALTIAQTEDKPILLSIGYSACHWCHVMAHESFEDNETAELMNRLFVNIKVDREERPDIDKIYQTAQSLLTQGTGGWPLTMFLNPHDLTPFYGGTYFPKADRFQLPSFKKVLQAIHEYYVKERAKAHAQGIAVKNALAAIYAPNNELPTIPPYILKTACDELATQFDSIHGGFGTAPKFPHPSHLALLIHQWGQTKRQGAADIKSLNMSLYTLEKMICGGIYDQLGGGFYRYAVDDKWLIPHFEKMLYDNGWLLGLLADAYLISGKTIYADAARTTVAWTIRDMQDEAGGFYSSMDADTESGEGMFYVWDKQEIETLLSDTEVRLISQHYGFNAPSNFEGKWHLHIAESLQKITQQNKTDAHQSAETITQAKHKLLAQREQRKPPATDDKVLTAWNALLIKGMAKVAIALNDAHCGNTARKALAFIHNTMWHDGKLSACWHQGKNKPIAYLDDYAFTLDAILHYLQYRWDTHFFAFALSIADTLIEQFEDKNNGGFFFTPEKHESLLQRPRILYDEALPCGYGIATLCLQQLGNICAHETYLRCAERALQQAAKTMINTPTACATLLCAFDEQYNPGEVIVLRGTDAELANWKKATHHRFSPTRLCFAIPNSVELPIALKDKKACNDIIAYVCQGTQCFEPIIVLEKYIHYLDGHR